MVPIALNAVPITPKIVWMMDWKTAKMELKIAIIPPKMDEMRFPRDSMREGMFAVVVDLFGLFGFGCDVLWCFCSRLRYQLISTLAMTSLLS